MISNLWSRNALVLIICCCVAGSALAHIKNEASQFPDIEFSESRFDIVVLVGAGIIPETPVFEPDKSMSKRELAVWAGLAADLGSGGETPDVTSLADSALDHGLVDTLLGDATLADINVAIFEGALSVENAETVPTKAEAATFIAEQLSLDAGMTLLNKKGLQVGATGVVTEVQSGDSHHGAATYIITIDGTSLPMYSHGHVANGPVDLLQWQGRHVGRSFVRGEGHPAMWIYLETEQIKELVVEEPTAQVVETPFEPSSADRNLLYGLAAAVVVLGLALFFRRRRQG